MLPEGMGGEGNLPAVRDIFLWRDNATWFIILNESSYFRLHYSNCNWRGKWCFGPLHNLAVWHLSMGDERKLKFSQTLSPKLNVGLSFVINYIILLWHNCSDNLSYGISNKTDASFMFVCLPVCMYLLMYLLGELAKTSYFCMPPEKWTALVFLDKWPVYLRASRALTKFEAVISLPPDFLIIHPTNVTGWGGSLLKEREACPSPCSYPRWVDVGIKVLSIIFVSYFLSCWSWLLGEIWFSPHYQFSGKSNKIHTTTSILLDCKEGKWYCSSLYPTSKYLLFLQASEL